MRWFQDCTPGEVIDLGTRALTQDEIVAFARESRRDANRGTVMLHSELVDDVGDVVLEMVGRGLFARRAATGENGAAPAG